MPNSQLNPSLLLEILLGIGDAIVVTDELAKIQFFNTAAETLFGYQSTEIVGQKLSLLIPEQNRIRHEELFTKFQSSSLSNMQMGGRADIQGLCKDGSVFLTKATITRITDNNTTYFVAQVMDQSEYQRLTSTERSLANAQRITHLGSWTWNVLTDKVMWSDEIFRIFGLERDGFAATYGAFIETVHPDDRERMARAISEAVNKNASFGIVHRIVRPNGEVRTIRAEAEVLYSEDNQATHMTGTVQDITEQVQIEEQLRQAQRLESIGKLTGGIAHDFNNLLMVVLGNLELMRRDAKALQSLTELIEDASNAAERGAKLTQRLLTFSRRQTLQPEVIDLIALVHNMEPVFRQSLGSKIHFKVNEDANLWKCQTDVNQLENALLNLAINARDAMPDGGEFLITLSNVSLDENFASLNVNINPGPFILLSISDNGHGMSAETMTMAFDPFFTTKEQGVGSGLGLSTVYGFVKQAEGCVQINSTVGVGTTIHIYLPKTNIESSTLPKLVQSTTEPLGANENILVVDDDISILRLTVEMLTRLGYRTHQAIDCKHALDILTTTPNLKLLLTDVILAAGENGVQLAKRAHEIQPGLAVVYMSGYTADTIEPKAHLNHAGDLLEKPFSKAQLARKVYTALHHN